ncbi:methyl-accepting chemotaxis protein [Sporolactobacillus sp. CPB3-1]|uniref:Methyl-accepting chemotaxis protein n=1 Tax=Sporolactobacillus mangiferae TaxID=2940498 RepID=A0ABT0MCK6_9BACL|nr:methyl-accepting chemotaxis protein [Sporolactobacillus mangiferae]MCL1632592.1 methyl-accepting chemotaxis protein [Sporolactobacillus mangiferae]
MKGNIRIMRLPWTDLTISMKFSIGLFIVLFLTLISATASAIILEQTMQKAEKAREAGERAAQITEIGSLFRAKDARVVDYLLNPGDQSVKLYTNDQMKLTKAEKRLKPYMKTPEQKKWFTQIMSADARTFNLFQSEFVPAVLMNDKQKITEVHKEQVKVQQSIISNVNKLRQSVINDEKRAIENVRNQVLGALVFLSVSVILTIAISVAVTMWIGRQTRTAFKQVIASTDRIASGDLSEDKEKIHNHKKRDELALIADSIEKMKLNLLTIVQAIRSAAEMTKKSGRTLIETTQTVSQESNETAKVMNEIAHGLEDQAASTSNMARFTEDFMHKLDQEVGTLASVVKKTINASKLTEEGEGLVEHSQLTMKLIDSSILEARQKMEHFKARLSNLNQLTELIDEIAGKTNLLALNATIESARAGDAGKGFQIIADSIRKLSNQTSESAKGMAELLQDIHEGSETVEEALSESRKHAETGVGQMKHTDEALASINNEVQIIGVHMKQVSERLQEVNQIGFEMKTSIDAVAAVAQETSASVTQVNQSMNRIEQTMTGITVEAQNLEETSEHFDQVVKQFKY